MGLEVYYRKDVVNAILAAEQATESAGGDGRYLEGYRAALVTIALALGLGPRQQTTPLPAWYPVALGRSQ